jgi:hypothetical protein
MHILRFIETTMRRVRGMIFGSLHPIYYGNHARGAQLNPTQ